MSKKVKPRIPTQELIKRLNLMHDSGGMLTKDRLNVIEQAAERLFELDERVAIMTEPKEVYGKAHVSGADTVSHITFQETFDLLSGGGEDESVTQ